MGDDSKGLHEPGGTRQLPHPGQPEGGLDAGADVFNAIGYEAADPSLHAPLWSEAVQAGPTGKIPR